MLAGVAVCCALSLVNRPDVDTHATYVHDMQFVPAAFAFLHPT